MSVSGGAESCDEQSGAPVYLGLVLKAKICMNIFHVYVHMAFLLVY